jgi:hypothetical protein
MKTVFASSSARLVSGSLNTCRYIVCRQDFTMHEDTAFASKISHYFQFH